MPHRSRATFSEMLVDRAKSLAAALSRAEIEQRALSINPRELASLIRGTGSWTTAGLKGAT